MAVKAKLDTLDGISADLAKEYKQVEADGKKFYMLDVDGAYLHDEDIGPLKRARDHEKKSRQDAESKAKEALTRAEQLQEEIDQLRRGAIPKGDVEKLEGSWKEKLAKKESELTAERDGALGTLKKLLVENVAKDIATKIAIPGASDLMLPHVLNRLTTEKTSDGYVTRVLDREGKPSALTIEELQKDLSTDKRFAAIITGSKASGGGANGGGDGRSGAPVPVDPKFNPATASPKQLAAHIAAKKAAGS